MATSDAIPERTPRPRQGAWSRTMGLLNPLKGAWWLFTNVRFAILLLALLAVVSLTGVLLPQKPLPVRQDVVAEKEWLGVQHGRFGFLTNPIDKLGLFDIFHSEWFAVLLTVTLISTIAYVVSRFPGVWRGITQPRVRVPDRYFEMAPNRARAGPVEPDRLVATLRAARYGVRLSEEDGATYLFADRFRWAALGTLLTHAAVIVFILSAVVSRADAFSSPLFLAEGSTLPVFPVSNPNQIQVQLTDAIGQFTPEGIPLDYRSEMVIYRRGDEVKRCESTVNSPCTYDGFKLYQTAYFGFGAAIEVTDTTTGNLIYRETLALAQRSDAPHLRITDAGGALLFDQPVVMTDAAKAGDIAYSAALLNLTNGRVITVWLPLGNDGQKLLVFEPASGSDAVRASLNVGDSTTSGGLTVSYEALETVPSAVVPDFPLPKRAGDGPVGEAFLEMSNVVYGTGRASEGTLPGAGAITNGPPALTMVGLRESAVNLEPGQSTVIDGLEYRFVGQREFSGITVRRDRSDLLIWIGAALIVAGLVVTFWVPRRRLWAKITATRTLVAGQAPSHANYSREMERLIEAAVANTVEKP